MAEFLRENSTGAVPEARYEESARESVDHLRSALAEIATPA
jgi:hypothetical protein